MASVEKLLEPIKIGKLELKNRMMMPALCSKYPTESGAVSDRMIDFYVERARGGASLIVIENTCIDWPVGKAGTNPIRADEWRYVHGLHDLAKAVQAHGTRIATQLHHTGRQNSTIASTDGEQLVAPSPIPCLPTGGEMPRELTIPEIDGIIGKYIMGASITKTAGFDAVEIHGAHGYLITQFMSPFTNKRTDEYGGDFEGRMRFPLRVVEGVRLAVGPDFPIIFRFSADEYIDGGLTLEDNKLIAQMLVDAGVDALSVSAGIYESTPWYSRIFPTMAMPEGCNVHLAAEIKKVVKVPVIVAGKLGNPEFAAEVLSSGKADIIAFGRPLLADPDLPKKVSQGRLDEIRPCIYCNEACAGNMSHFWRIECVVNPELGREREYKIRPAEKAKRVLVIGGGPAGMEAARVASLRGHHVTLHEKDNALGGQLTAASVPQFKRPIQNFAEYLRRQMGILGVMVQMGSEATPESIRKMLPEVVILATGSSHTIPDIPGIGSTNVATASDILLGRKQPGDRVAVIGGGQVGCELAWFLAEQGKKVTVIEAELGIANDMNMFSRFYLTDKLAELGVEIAMTTTAEEITSEGVVTVDASGNRRVIEADTVAIATGFRSNTGLDEKIKGDVPEVYSIGGCLAPGTIWEAVRDGARVAREI